MHSGNKQPHWAAENKQTVKVTKLFSLKDCRYKCTCSHGLCLSTSENQFLQEKNEATGKVFCAAKHYPGKCDVNARTRINITIE